MPEIVKPILESILGVKPPPQHYFVRPNSGEILFSEEVSRSDFLVPLADQAWSYELFFGDERTLFSSIRDYFSSGKFLPRNPFVYAREAKSVAWSLAISDRVANGCKQGLIESPENPEKLSASGVLVNMARNNPLSTHGQDHERRLGVLARGVILGVPELRHGPQAITAWIPSLLYFIPTHDQTQSVREYLNLYTPFYSRKEHQLDTKVAHAAEGGLSGWITRELYKFESQQTDDNLVNRQMAGSLIMGLLHDETGLVFKRLKATGQANQIINLDKENLNDLIEQGLEGKLGQFLDKWNKAKINPGSLTPAHVWLLMRAQQLEQNFHYQGSKYGFHSLFEKDWTRQIKKMKADRKTIGEYLNLKSADDEKALFKAVDVSVRIDLGDMLIPVDEPLVRMLKVPRSGKRRFYKPLENQGQMVDLITSHPTGNFKDEVTSDVLRMWWEMMNFEGGLEDPDLINSRYVREQFIETTLARMLVLKEVGGQLMRGDFSGLEQSYQKRINRVHLKALRRVVKETKGIINKVSVRQEVLDMIRLDEDPQRYLVDQLDKLKIKNQYQQRLTAIGQELGIIKQIFKDKPDSIDGQPRIYSQPDINQYRQLADQCISLFIKKYRLPGFKVARTSLTVVLNSLPLKAPYKSPDTIAHPRAAKTLIARSALVDKVLDDITEGLAITLKDLFDPEFVDNYGQAT